MATLPAYFFTGKLDHNRHIMAVTKHWSVVNRTRAVDHSTFTQDEAGNVNVERFYKDLTKNFQA